MRVSWALGVGAAVLLAGCAGEELARREGSEGTPSSVADVVRWIERDDCESFQIEFPHGEDFVAKLSVAHDSEESLFNITLETPDGKSMTVQECDGYSCGLKRIGLVNLYGAQGDAVLLETVDWGTGGSVTGLKVLSPWHLESIGLDLFFSAQSTNALTGEQRTANYFDPRFEKERRFLERLKWDYGFVDEAVAARKTDQLEYAPYFWAKANDEITDGRMTIRRLEGRHPDHSTIQDRLRDGSIVYTPFFKGAVWGYDESLDESFVVFHPHDMYCWPTQLFKSGDWLLINTRGEGVALVNVNTWHLKRVEYPAGDVQTFAVASGKAVIDGSPVVDLP